MISFRHMLSLAVLLLLQACTVLSQGQSTQIETRIQQLRTEVAEMKSEFARTRETLQARNAETEQGDGMLAARLDTVQATLETLPSRIDVTCPAPAPVETIKVKVDGRELDVPKTMPDPMTSMRISGTKR